MKGIITAGGAGLRLYPATRAVSKQLLPVFDKPMVFYPLATLMLAGIREVLIISTPLDLEQYRRLLGDGSDIGIRLHYKEQPHPGGIAQAFHLGKSFIEDEAVCLVLGDNVFHGESMVEQMQHAARRAEAGKGATIFGYRVTDPQRYGVMAFDTQNRLVGIEEKPTNPSSDYAVVGLYFYDSSVSEVAEIIMPSARGELEITDVNNHYLKQGSLHAEILKPGTAWLDTGTHQTLLEASNYIQAIEHRQGIKIACLEAIAYQQGWITADQVFRKGEQMANVEYGQYLLRLVEKVNNSL